MSPVPPGPGTGCLESMPRMMVETREDTASVRRRLWVPVLGERGAPHAEPSRSCELPRGMLFPLQGVSGRASLCNPIIRCWGTARRRSMSSRCPLGARETGLVHQLAMRMCFVFAVRSKRGQGERRHAGASGRVGLSRGSSSLNRRLTGTPPAHSSPAAVGFPFVSYGLHASGLYPGRLPRSQCLRWRLCCRARSPWGWGGWIPRVSV